MPDYEVGYKKPPVAHQFKPGVSPNPKGRPRKSGPNDLAGIIVGALDDPIKYQDGERTKAASGRELNIMMLVKRAVRGDIDSALTLLKMRDRAERTGSAEPELIEVLDWTPDFDGQTAEQKTQAYLNMQNATPVEWWATSKTTSSKPDQD